ncbi:MAG: hypothetical protein DCC49_13795 [Acidobacteria bacterium]|nr:MAG: hypothetical protein DCC49_13795 [Acidobacteriota bacterium]
MSAKEAPTAMRSRNSDGTYSNYFFVTNTHGDVVALTDRVGAIVNRYAYGPWGEATRVSESVHQPFRYAGYRYEDGFDLYYLRARWMDPGTGRFLSRDDERGTNSRLLSINRYVYAALNPPSATDPSGHAPRRPTIGQGIYALFPQGECTTRNLGEWRYKVLAYNVAQYLASGGAFEHYRHVFFPIDPDPHFVANHFGWGGFAQGEWDYNVSPSTLRFDSNYDLCLVSKVWFPSGHASALWVLIHEMQHADQEVAAGGQAEFRRTYPLDRQRFEADADCKADRVIGVLARGYGSTGC